MKGFEVPELRDKPVIRWIESTPVDRALILTGKTLVNFGIVAGIYMLLAMSMPRAGFFGIGARGAGITLEGLLLAGYIVLYHARWDSCAKESDEAFRCLRQFVQTGPKARSTAKPRTNSAGGRETGFHNATPT